MATVTLTHESTYEFDVDTFVEEWHEEFLDWLEDQDEEEGYAESETARKDFVEDQIHELGGDDIRWASHVFKEKDDDFTMDVRGIWS
jgi:hypothetical protein